MRHLFINIDHVATIRQARAGTTPDPVAAAVLCELGGADGITLHLREDRRHVQDHDLKRLMETTRLPVNLEMAATEEMVQIALAHRPARVTLVPEKRQEITTEGGLDVVSQALWISQCVERLQLAGIPVSLFVDPDSDQIHAAKQAGTKYVELHTGSYANAFSTEDFGTQWTKIRDAAQLGDRLGIIMSAGHGLDRRNVVPLRQIHEIKDYHIGHSVIAHAVMVGMKEAVQLLRESILS
jgi:pyridoxine 5-phosphate synthase